MQLLQDVFIVENLQIITEGKANSTMKIRGVFGRCNEKNNNGRIYPTAVLETQLAKVQPLISERRLCGELDHPQNDTVKLANASHLITKLEMKGNELIGEAEVLKTPAGLTAQALINGGVKIGISSRGMGTLSEDHNGDKIVNEDFRLVTFDLVADPSTRGAFPGLSESTQGKFATEKLTKLKKESNFITMLESKMRDAYVPFIEEAEEGKKKKKSDDSERREGESVEMHMRRTQGWPKSAELSRRGVTPSVERPTTLGRGAHRRDEAFEIIKADGHWHRIAEALAEAMGYDCKKKVNEEAAAEKEETGSASLLQKRMRPQDAQATGRPEGMLGRGVRHSQERRHAKRLAIAQAKGARKGASQLAKGDVEAARIRARGAAGGSVSMNPLSPGRQSYGQATRALQQRQERSQRKIDRAGTATPQTSAAAPAAAAPAAVAPAAPKPAAPAAVAPAPAAPAAVAPAAPKPAAPKPAAEIPDLPAGTQKRGGAKRQQSKAQKREAEIAAHQAKLSGKPAAPPTGGPVSTSGRGVAPHLQRRYNRIMSKKGSSRQGLAVTRDRMIKRGDLNRTGEGGDITASRAYKQIGIMLAEMFNLREDKNWIQDAEKSIERRGTEGKCTPITKPGCTGRAKTLAKTFKKMAENKKKEKSES